VKINSYRLTYIAGFIGSLALTLGSIITALAYTGANGQRYSPLNQFVSELGELGVSAQAGVFNLGLIISGISFAVFMVGLATMIKGRLRYPFAIIGLIVGLFGMLVGVFPMNNLDTHRLVAFTFFNTGWIAIALFTLYIIFAKPPDFPRWLIIPGVLTVVSFIAFLVTIRLSGPTGSATLSAPSLENRPDVWWTTIFEWLVIVTITAWTALVSFHLWRTRLAFSR
jgi:hypothetical membrane protein